MTGGPWCVPVWSGVQPVSLNLLGEQAAVADITDIEEAEVICTSTQGGSTEYRGQHTCTNTTTTTNTISCHLYQQHNSTHCLQI